VLVSRRLAWISTEYFKLTGERMGADLSHKQKTPLLGGAWLHNLDIRISS